MLSRENRVLLASFSVLALCVVVVGVTGIGRENTVLELVLFAGGGVLGPQLYLAATDDEISLGARVRTGIVVTALIALSVGSTAEPPERAMISAIVLGLLGALVIYEFVAGYRASIN